MLRLVLLVLYLAASFSSGDLHGNLDPDGLPSQPTGDLTGNLDPNG
ncbi:MAG: hypothetical protein ACJ759_17315 [Thermoanaerobaculia bacterium]